MAGKFYPKKIKFCERVFSLGTNLILEKWKSYIVTCIFAESYAIAFTLFLLIARYIFNRTIKFMNN